MKASAYLRTQGSPVASAMQLSWARRRLTCSETTSTLSKQDETYSQHCYLSAPSAILSQICGLALPLEFMSCPGAAVLHLSMAAQATGHCGCLLLLPGKSNFHAQVGPLCALALINHANSVCALQHDAAGDRLGVTRGGLHCTEPHLKHSNEACCCFSLSWAGPQHNHWTASDSAGLRNAIHCVWRLCCLSRPVRVRLQVPWRSWDGEGLLRTEAAPLLAACQLCQA